MTGIVKVDTILKNDGSVPTAKQLGLNVAGNILQIVSTTKTDVFSSTSSSPVAVTGLAVTITPTNTSSKVLVRIVFNAGGDTSTANCDYYIYRNGSLLSTAIGDAAGSEQRSAAHIDPSASRMHYNNTIEFLDSPATTSATTYQLYQRSQPNYNFYINRSSYNDGNTGRTISTITATEVAV